MAHPLNKLIRIFKDNLDDNNFLKHYEMFIEEKKEMTKRKIRKILEQQYQLESLGDMLKELKKLEESNKVLLKEKTAEEHNNSYLWITINPKPEIKLVDFIKKIEKLVKRKIFTNYLYVYEQRGKTEEEQGKGFHAHILAKRNLNYKPFKTHECIRNTCKTLVKNHKDNSTINIQNIGEEFAADKKEYILGEKTGEEKDLKQQIDIIWRKNNNLKKYYNDGPEKTSEA
jgi:hypothetical protein